MIETTNLVVSSNLLMSTSKWFNRFAFAFASTGRDLSRTAPMLRRYPAGSTCGSGALGRLILGIAGFMGADILVKLEKPGVPGVTGDFSDDCEDIDVTSARLDEFLREPPEVVDSEVFLREKRPMTQGVLWFHLSWNVVVPYRDLV
jgi:hypothetical protein